MASPPRTREQDAELLIAAELATIGGAPMPAKTRTLKMAAQRWQDDPEFALALTYQKEKLSDMLEDVVRICLGYLPYKLHLAKPTELADIMDKAIKNRQLLMGLPTEAVTVNRADRIERIAALMESNPDLVKALSSKLDEKAESYANAIPVDGVDV